MNLDAMKAKWAEQDQNIHLNRQLLISLYLQSGNCRVQRLRAFTALHALAWFGCIVALGDFIYEHLANPHFALAAAAVDLYAIVFLSALIRQLAIAGRIDYLQPVTAIQKQLERVRILRIRTTQWAVLAGVVLWAPAFIVVAKACLEVDIYTLFGPTWVAANLLFGLTLIPVTLWLSKKFAARLIGSSFMQQIMRDLAGHNLIAALDFLSTVARFEDPT